MTHALQFYAMVASTVAAGVFAYDLARAIRRGQMLTAAGLLWLLFDALMFGAAWLPLGLLVALSWILKR